MSHINHSRKSIHQSCSRCIRFLSCFGWEWNRWIFRHFPTLFHLLWHLDYSCQSTRGGGLAQSLNYREIYRERRKHKSSHFEFQLNLEQYDEKSIARLNLPRSSCFPLRPNTCIDLCHCEFWILKHNHLFESSLTICLSLWHWGKILCLSLIFFFYRSKIFFLPLIAWGMFSCTVDHLHMKKELFLGSKTIHST